MRQDVVLELRIGTYLLGILGHTHVALIDEQRVLLGLEVLFLPDVRFRIPNLSGEYLRIVVLHHAAAPCWDALALATVPLHLHLIELAVLNGLLRELQLPVASTLNALAPEFLILRPVVEVADQIDVSSIRSPLTEHPALRKFMKSEIEMTRSKICQFLLSVLCQLVQFPECMVMTSADGTLEGLQPRVVLHQAYMLGLCLLNYLLNLLGCYFPRGCLLGGCSLLCCRFLSRRFFLSHIYLFAFLPFYFFTLNIAFLISGSVAIQGACPSCGKKMAIWPGLQVT